MVAFQEVDWALGKFTITNIRDTVVDYTAPFWHESAQIVMKKPSNDALFLYLGPFRHDVWLCLLASVPITTAVTAVTFYVESLLNQPSHEPKLRQYFCPCFWLIFRALFQQGHAHFLTN